MTKKLLLLSFAICCATSITFAQDSTPALNTQVGITSNSTFKGPAFFDVFYDITPKSTTGEIGTGKNSMILQLNGASDVARSWGFSLNSTEAAIAFMFNNGLTRFGSIDNYMGDNTIRRDEAATFYARFAAKALGITPDTNTPGCNFTDMDKVDLNLKDDVRIACQMGLFKGHAGKFLPTDRFTVGQSLTVLIRIIDGYKSETGSTHWAGNYRKSAYAMGLTDTTMVQLDTFIQRADVAKLLEAGAIIEQLKAKARTDGYVAISFQNAASLHGGIVMLLTAKDADVSAADKKTVVGGLGSISNRYWIDL